ncbi:MAG: hypothetical protein ACNA8P_10350, partial [Phycisphaerales bacterium]
MQVDPKPGGQGPDVEDVIADQCEVVPWPVDLLQHDVVIRDDLYHRRCFFIGDRSARAALANGRFRIHLLEVLLDRFRVAGVGGIRVPKSEFLDSLPDSRNILCLTGEIRDHPVKHCIAAHPTSFLDDTHHAFKC